MSADVVVVGAGVVGASVAWHLRRRGARVTIVDRADAPGAGSTRLATGGFRAQFSTEINVRLSLLARDKLRCFADEIGADPGYRPVGYLWLAHSRAALAALAEAQAVQRRAGLGEARLLVPGEIAAVNPTVRLDGIEGAAYCPSDGFIAALAILRGYLAAAERAGVTTRLGVRVIGFERDAAGRITVVRTSGGDLAAGAVVDAAGPWAAELARLAGVTLPVFPLRRQVASTVPSGVISPDLPMTLWTDDGFHVRERDGRVLLLWPTPGNPADPFDASVEDEWLAEVARKAAERVPRLSGVPIDRARSWAGLYEMSPDKHAIVGAAPGCENLYFVNGSSGHGVMHAPALGHLLAELIIDGAARTLDISPLRPSRFSDGQPLPVTDVL